MDIFSKIFWKRVLENDIHAFSGGMLGVVVAEKTGVLSQVPWTSALQVGAMGAIISTLATLASQEVPNTPTGSFLPPKNTPD